MSVLVLTVGSVAAPTQLATPTNFTATASSDGTVNTLASDTVAHADQYWFQKQLDNSGVWGQIWGPNATPLQLDPGLTLDRHRKYRTWCTDSTGTYTQSDYAVSGDVYTASSGITMPTVAKVDMSFFPNLPAVAGLESEQGFTAGIRGVILEVDGTALTKTNTYTPVIGFPHQYRCSEADALEISETLNTLPSGNGYNASTPVVVVYRSSGILNFGRDLLILKRRMSVLYHTAPSPGRIYRRTNVRIAADDVWLWHPHFIQGSVGSTPLLENADGIQIGASSFYGTPIQRSGAFCGTFVGATDESDEKYSAGNDLVTVKCNFPFPLSNAGRGERHACGSIHGEIPNRCTNLYCNFGGGDFRQPLYSRAPLSNNLGGFTVNSYGQWFNIDPNNRANGGFGPNVRQINNLAGHLFIKGQGATNEELVQIHEYPFNVPATMVTGSVLHLYLNATAGFSGAINDANQLSYVHEYNGGAFGSGSPTTGANAAYYSTSSINTTAWPSTYVPLLAQGSLAYKRTYVQLMSQICGSRPNDRGTWNYDKQFFEMALNEVDLLMGASMSYPTTGRHIRVDALTDIPGSGVGGSNGYPGFSSTNRDLRSGTHPMPTDPETLIPVSGTTRQIKKILAWAIEEHNSVVGVVEPSLIS